MADPRQQLAMAQMLRAAPSPPIQVDPRNGTSSMGADLDYETAHEDPSFQPPPSQGQQPPVQMHPNSIGYGAPNPQAQQAPFGGGQWSAANPYHEETAEAMPTPAARQAAMGPIQQSPQIAMQPDRDYGTVQVQPDYTTHGRSALGRTLHKLFGGGGR